MHPLVRLDPMAEFTAKKVSKVKGVDADASYSVDGIDGGTFIIAFSKKELKQRKNSNYRRDALRSFWRAGGHWIELA